MGGEKGFDFPPSLFWVSYTHVRKRKRKKTQKPSSQPWRTSFDDAVHFLVFGGSFSYSFSYS